jgi:hypothetical protein
MSNISNWILLTDVRCLQIVALSHGDPYVPVRTTTGSYLYLERVYQDGRSWRVRQTRASRYTVRTPASESAPVGTADSLAETGTPATSDSFPGDDTVQPPN